MTRWEKDGRELPASVSATPFESRGVRGLSFRNLSEADTGTYSVRITGTATNLYTSCRVNVIGRLSSSMQDI